MDVNSVTTLVGFVAGLSVATERLTEVIKGVPGISSLLAVDMKGSKEELRKAVIHVVAIAIGAFLTYLSYSQIATAIGSQSVNIGVCLLFGAMAAGGSGMWNSVLDIVRGVNKQKQIATDQLAASANPQPAG
jgi:hypothetical protein